ncbi:hypothetical protein [Devosia ginsengisoli]|uniref:Uncharacterized protein n=1 Tax=Devosia ginsengisoli TaxID=400770 RepID=A0A5B8LW16_9HYPH|nr:hypothetical protein [Devosia ginsengisoli]QDZ11590.1 hypothetical protein FPZ08_12975 [Devosia ginsengisoli]
MQEESIVRDIEISDGRQVHKASYYVENGMLHARIGGKMISLVTGAETSDEAVRRLLSGHIQTKAWRQRLAERWFGPGTSR